MWRCNEDIFIQERSKNVFLTYAYLEATEECVRESSKAGEDIRSGKQDICEMKPQDDE